MAGKCVKRFCNRVSGRHIVDDLDGQLLATNGSSSAAVRSAELGLRQVGRLRQGCDALAPLVSVALSETPATASTAGEVTLSAIRTRLTELEAMLRLAAAGRNEPLPTPGAKGTATRRSRRIREVASCIAREGNEKTWRPGHLLLTTEGLRFEAKEEAAGAKKVQMIPWYEIVQVVTRHPEQQQEQAGRGAGAVGRSLLHEAELELRRPPGRLRLQFGAAGPLRTLDVLWQEERGNGDGLAGIPAVPSESLPVTEASPKGSPMEACDALIEELRRTGGLPTCELSSCYKTSLQMSQGRALAQVYEQLKRSDEDSTLARMWRARNVTEWDIRPWEAFGADFVCRVMFRLPLRPQPLTPKTTRMGIVYHLRRGASFEEPVIFTVMSRSLDVPYATVFTVQIQHIFSVAGEEVEVDNIVGVGWSGRCMVRSIVESSSRSETVIGSKALVENLLDSMGVTPISRASSTA